jgi:hypothetical protein
VIALINKVRNVPEQIIDVVVIDRTQEISITQDVIFVPVHKDVPEYQGEYNVTPKIVEQTLPTKEKLLLEDMTIKAIPFFNVSNTSGGSTVYIGKEV